MTTQVQFRRGTATENNAFTGLEGELSVNTTNYALRVHDGSTQGGYELMLASGSNISGNIPSSNISGDIEADTLADGSTIDGGTF